MTTFKNGFNATLPIAIQSFAVTFSLQEGVLVEYISRGFLMVFTSLVVYALFLYIFWYLGYDEWSKEFYKEEAIQ